MNRKTLFPTLLLTTGALIFGCGVKPPIEGRQDPYTASQIHFTSEDLRTSTAVGAPKLARSDSGQLLYVTVPIRATTDQTLYIDYRVTFLDKSGQLVNQTGWINRTLYPNVFDQITVNSPSSKAADFQVDFRYAK